MTISHTSDSIISRDTQADQPANTSCNTPACSTVAMHRDVRRRQGLAHGNSQAEFVERTLDVSAGVHTCLRLVQASDQARLRNQEGGPGGPAVVPLGIEDGNNLMRLSMAVTALLREDARHQAESMNAVASP